MSTSLEQLAREALHEITEPATIGGLVEETVVGPELVTLAFAAAAPGYPGWRWTVSVATLTDLDPSVLEVELLPGEGALLAPDWLPWSDRLEEYRAAQAAAGEPDESESSEADGPDESDDDVLDTDDELDDALLDLESEQHVATETDVDAPGGDEDDASAPVVPPGDDQQHDAAADTADRGPEKAGVRRRWGWRKKKDR
jgi:hypothetical protein